MPSTPSYVLVTGATGFIGAHVVDDLLSRGIKVRGATRSQAKGDAMIAARPQYAGKLDFVQVGDFEKAVAFEKAVEGVDGVIHVASPFTFAVTDNEKELILPAINGVKSILEAATKNPAIHRIVITSSFAAVIDVNRKAYTYTAKDWNPLTYEESIDKATSPIVAYRGSKKFAELAAWDFVRDRKPGFDIVTICPPMVFGPVVHPVDSIASLNESNAGLWKVAAGEGALPGVRVPFWVDGRDVAKAHVEALLRPAAGGKRYVVAAPKPFSYELAATIIADAFPWAKDKVSREKQTVDDSLGIDGQTAATELGIDYLTFEQTVTDFVRGASKIKGANV